jgi:hypothetical protein
MPHKEDYTRLMLNNIRALELQSKMNNSFNKLLNEGYEGDYNNVQDITITKENFPDLVEEIKASLIQKIPNVRLDDDYLRLNKQKNTLTLTGIVQNLNNLEFTITTDISNDDGLYVTVEGLNLTQGALQTLQILQGFSKVFINEWTINKVADTFKIT